MLFERAKTTLNRYGYPFATSVYSTKVVELDDCDLVVVGDGEDLFAGVFGADAEVVHPAGASDAHLVFGVEAVVAQAVVLW